jgi:hypothetical protein
MNKYQTSALINSVIIAAAIAVSVPAKAQSKSSSGGAPLVPTYSSGTNFQTAIFKSCVNSFVREIKGKNQSFVVTYNCKGKVLYYTTKLIPLVKN